ncbi:CLIP-associated protein [Cardamine amara subsp. amara]|uniref:CLIP-associated protein n=1 Tax=Cardamine amara subsp. amara TaxID=228776 RepID=A0ABD1A9E1_CARAN
MFDYGLVPIQSFQMLKSEDEKTLVACINCLTKLVGRQELMDQLSSFLHAVFEAFGSQSADVRKTVVFK